MRAFGPRVLVVDPPMADEKERGIYLPYGGGQAHQGIVIDVGDLVPLTQSEVLKGDRIYYLPEGVVVQIGDTKVINAEFILTVEEDMQ